MNANTNKTQISPDLIDKAEEIGTTLEQAECALNLLFNEYQSSPHLPVFMVINDLIVKAKQQNSELLRDLPKARTPPAFPVIHRSLKNLVTGDIRGEAFELVAIAKAISEWSANQSGFPIEKGILDMDTDDIVSLSGMAIRRAQRIVELTNEFESKVTSIGVQA